MATHEMKRTRGARESLFTTLWGWFTAPRFGSAGSGGLEYEPLPSPRTAESSATPKR